MEAKDAAVEAVKNSGLGLMKAVKASFMFIYFTSDIVSFC
jgi:hypothetical protein